MEQLVGGLVSLAIFAAIIYAIGRAALAPIHAKLDRLLERQDDLVRAAAGHTESAGETHKITGSDVQPE